MKPFDRESLIASTKNRFRGLFSSVILRAALGEADPQRCVDVRRLIEEKACIYIDLSPGGRMGPRQQALLANVWLSEIFHVVLNTPPEERRAVLVICDELPVFAGSAPLITFCLPQTRKHLLRFVGLFQGTQRFPEGVDDRLLHTMVSCTNKLIFRHTDSVDAQFWGRILSLPTLDVTKEKFRYYEQEQYQDGWRVTTLVDRAISRAYSEITSESEGGGDHQGANWNNGASVADTDQVTANKSHTTADGTSHTDQTSVTDSDSTTDSQGAGEIRQQDLIRESFNQARAQQKAEAHTDSQADTDTHNEANQVGSARTKGRQKGRNASRGGVRGMNRTWNRSRQRQLNSAESITYKQQTQPILKWRSVLKFIEFLSLEDQSTMTASDVARQQTGQLFLYISGQLPYQLQLPLLPPPFPGAPKAAARRRAEFLAELYELPAYRTGDQILLDRERVLHLAIQQLQGLSQQQQQQQRRRLSQGPLALPPIDRLNLLDFDAGDDSPIGI